MPYHRQYNTNLDRVPQIRSFRSVDFIYYGKNDDFFSNRRAGGGPTSGCSSGVKITLGLLGTLMVCGTIAGVGVPLFFSLKSAQGLTKASTIGKLK